MPMLIKLPHIGKASANTCQASANNSPPTDKQYLFNDTTGQRSRQNLNPAFIGPPGWSWLQQIQHHCSKPSMNVLMVSCMLQYLASLVDTTAALLKHTEFPYGRSLPSQTRWLSPAQIATYQSTRTWYTSANGLLSKQEHLAAAYHVGQGPLEKHTIHS